MVLISYFVKIIYLSTLGEELRRANSTVTRCRENIVLNWCRKGIVVPYINKGYVPIKLDFNLIEPNSSLGGPESLSLIILHLNHNEIFLVSGDNEAAVKGDGIYFFSSFNFFLIQGHDMVIFLLDLWSVNIYL